MRKKKTGVLQGKQTNATLLTHALTLIKHSEDFSCRFLISIFIQNNCDNIYSSVSQ